MLEEERQAVADACRRLARDGLVTATSGNVSLRRDDRVAVTPTGGVLAEMRAEDVAGASESQPVVLPVTGDVAAGPASPLRVQPGVCVRIMTGAMMPAGRWAGCCHQSACRRC